MACLVADMMVEVLLCAHQVSCWQAAVIQGCLKLWRPLLQQNIIIFSNKPWWDSKLLSNDLADAVV